MATGGPVSGDIPREVEEGALARFQAEPDDWIILLDENGRIVYESNRAEQVLGAANRLGTLIVRHVYSGDLPLAYEKMAISLARRGSEINFAIRALDSDGGVRRVSVMAANCIDEPGIEAMVLRIRPASSDARPSVPPAGRAAAPAPEPVAPPAAAVAPPAATAPAGARFEVAGVVAVGWDSKLNLLSMEWLGWANSSEFRGAFGAALEVLRRHRGGRCLVDCRRMRAIVEVDQTWISEAWFPQAVSAGLHRMALVTPDSALARTNLESIVARSQAPGVDKQMFPTVESAQAWLR